MNFYTNVHLHKAEILLRGYKDGERVQQAIRYNPYLFEPNRVYRERGVETPFKTLKGEPVYKREFDSVFAKGGADLRNNEYIVYNSAQCTVSHLIEIGN